MAEFFTDVDTEANDIAADLRRRALELQAPTREVIFEHVYSEPHPLMAEQAEWLHRFETSFDTAPDGSAA